MKKFFILLLAAVVATCTAACSRQTVTYSPEKPYWLDKDSYGNTVKVDFSETCLYRVSHKQAQTPNAAVSVEYSDDCVYKTELVAAKYPENGENYCYLLTVTYDMKGKYKAGETEYPFEDLTVYRTYFTWDSGFNFIYSEQKAQSTLPVNAAAAKDDKGNVIAQIAFETTVSYEGNKAETSFAITGGDPSYFALDDGFASTFKKYNKTNYIDANMLAYALRAFDFTPELNYSFTTIDALSNTKHNMQYRVNEATKITAVNLKRNEMYLGDTSFKEDGTLVNGEGKRYDKVLEADAYSVDVRLNETYNGTAMTCVYFADAAVHRHYMYSALNVLPYNLGTLEYTLTEINING
ncbi:MAG: hypothetical protein J6Z34_02980 [Clostridia bacterium]|nr:hypothetical protein [Clostridia bacterium]